ncbi:HepT-like ribonuclease domain-containing protein [Geminocystis sp. CENA526]|uniref:HepT-like ribonuclease domain-containing protein n=1 Tax=Geminocystis sp. CENA526 TaxID=1355871 RepID=UPI003D6F7622
MVYQKSCASGGDRFMKDSALYLIHVRECLEKINSYLPENKKDFLETSMVQDAILRNLEIMGESIKKLPQEWKDTQPQIEWIKIGNFRNVLAHEYLGVDLDTVWLIIEDYLPELKKAVTQMCDQLLNGEV